MKAYGIKKKDDDCCPGHAKYGQRGLTAKGNKRPRNKAKDKPRKAKERHKPIEDDSQDDSAADEMIDYWNNSY